MADIFPESREEEILVSMIDGEEYNKAPESRIEALLLELKEVIEEGGGGGGTTNYNLLQNKPSINSVTLTGDKSSADLGIPTGADLAGKQDALPVTASGNDVAFNGDIIDGQGNTLSVLAEALTKTASGNPVVITDCAGGKARSLITEINAIQDLHGYDKPWVGGAGKNKLPMTVSAIKAANTDGTWTGNDYVLSGVTFSILTDAAGNVTGIKGHGTASEDWVIFKLDSFTLKQGNYILNGITTGSGSTYRLSLSTGGTEYNIYDNPTNVSVAADAPNSQMRFIVRTAGTTIDNVTLYPMLRLSTVSDATFAPYSNICPISGRDSVAVDDTGKNLLPITADSIKTLNGGASSWSNNSKVINGVTFKLNTDSDGNLISISTSGTASGNANLDLVRNFTVSASFLSGTPSGSTGNNYYIRCGIDGTYYTDSGNGVAINGTITSVWIGVANGNTAPSNPWLPMIESGSAKTSYEPYAHSSATIQLGTTVYGADINWVTGVMTVKTARIAYNGSENWTASNGSVTACMRVESPVISDAEKNSANNHLMGLISNMFKEKTPDQTYVGGESNIGFAIGMDGKISVCQTGSKNMVVADWKTWLATNPLQVEYPLATPTTIQLTPEQLELLKGYNRVTIDNGSIEIEYIAKAISGNDEEIAPLVGDKATKAYAVNDFIERADGLYRVTAPIASGASFTANNTVKMSIGEALTYLYNK